MKSAEPAHAEIYNMVGKKIWSGVIDKSNFIDVSSYPAGIYFLKVIYNDGRNGVKLFSKK